jgi:glutamate racemase
MGPCIGIFDSGVGGLSVLRALRSRLPRAALVYVADAAHAPYGERDPAAVLDRSLRLTEHLLREGARMVVVACNTATALAIDALRAHWPATPFVGVEPGIKPAARLTRNGRIGVLATPATLASTRIVSLIDRHAGGAHVTLQPCPGLAAAIERGDLDDVELGALLDRYCAPLREDEVDTVVLGCTHYPFVATRIAALLPGAQLIDTAEPVAERVQALWTGPDHELLPRLLTTGSARALSSVATQWLGLAADAQRIEV